MSIWSQPIGAKALSLEITEERRPQHSHEILNALSVDVEDYYQVGAFEKTISRHRWEEFEPRVDRNTRSLLELFAQHDVKATFFVLGWVAERWPDLVTEIHRAGHELAAHGYDHRRVTTLSPEEFRIDVRCTKQMLEDLSGAEVVGYRAPSYSIVRRTLWAIDILAEEGFRYDSSIFPIRHDRYGIPDAPRFPWLFREQEDLPLKEFPISTLRVMGMNLPFVGGGYLRHFPFWFSRWGMKRVNNVDLQSAVVYVHPWEIDPDQPRIEARWLTRQRHYRNLDKTRSRLERLFHEFKFATVRKVLEI